MPANIERLTEILAEMKAIYLADPRGAVRGQRFIRVLHSYCVEELANLGFDRDNIVEEAKVFGSHNPKNVDVAYIDPINGPLIIIGVRSQMSSVANNVLNYYEGIIGDCTTLHDRFPMAVISYVYLLPLHPILEGHEARFVDLDRAEILYRLITNRGDWRNPKDKFEHFSFLKVDFDHDPPHLLDTIEELKINTLFDKIKETFLIRNFFLEIQV